MDASVVVEKELQVADISGAMEATLKDEDLTGDHKQFVDYCKIVVGTFGPLFHIGCALLGSGFLMPQSSLVGQMSMRLLAAAALAIHSAWAIVEMCSGPMFLYAGISSAINLAYFCVSIALNTPVMVPKHLEPLFVKVFRPLRVSKKDFKVLTKDCYTSCLKQGDFFALEGFTAVDDKLHILLSGRLSVKCDGIFLHTVGPNEFINSIEWMAREVEGLGRQQASEPFQIFGRLLMNTGLSYQVTVEAMTPCQVLVFTSRDLDAVCHSLPGMKTILNSLVGRDVSKKLYATTENVNLPNAESSRKNLMGNMINFRRTASADAINVGAKGFVRSRGWVDAASERQLIRDTAAQVIVMNMELDLPPTMDYLPQGTPVHTVDKDTVAEAQFLAHQRKFWPSGLM